MIDTEVLLPFSNEQALLPGQVKVQQAFTTEQQIGRLNVVTKRYSLQGYLEGIQEVTLPQSCAEDIINYGDTLLQATLSAPLYEEFLRHGLVINTGDGHSLYFDRYLNNSIPIVAETSDGFIGSARIIISEKGQLPTLTDPTIQIMDEWKSIASEVTAEFSQFAVEKGSGKAQASLGILRTAIGISRILGINKWLATTDDAVMRMLNSNNFRFGIPKIGPTVNYLGSNSTPNYININTCIANAAQHLDSFAMSQFIDGQEVDVEAFEWYVGM